MRLLNALKHITLLLILIVADISGAEDKTPLSLDEAINIALENNPDIAASDARIKVSRALVKNSKSKYYPQISSRIIVPFVGRESGFFLDQIIWDFGRTSNRVKSSKSQLESSEFNKASTENDLILETRIGYYTVLVEQHLALAADKKQLEYEKRLAQAEGFHNAGRITRNDLTRAEVDLGNTKLGVITAKNNLEIAKLNLLTLMGVEGEFNYELKDSQSFKPQVIEIDVVIEQSVNSRDEIKSLLSKEESMRANLEVARKEFYPVIFGRTAYRFEGKGAETPGFIAGIGLTFPIFEGFSRFAKVEAAEGELEGVRAEIRAAKAVIKSEIKRVHMELGFAEQNIVVTKQARDSAEKSLLLAQERYRLGRASDVELAEAEHLFASTNASYMQSIYNYNIISSRLERAIGEPYEVNQ